MFRVAAAASNMNCWINIRRRTSSFGRLLLLALLSSLLFVTTGGQQDNTCDGLKAEAIKLLTGGCGADSANCSCETNEDGTFYASCQDLQRMCSTLDSSVCGTQSSIFHYDDFGDSFNYYYFTYDSGVKTLLKTYTYVGVGICDASITDAAGTKTPCECSTAQVCSDFSLEPYVTCTDYQSGAIANGCMDDWGVQGGVLLALSIKSGLCVAAPAADTPVTAAPVPAPVAVAPVAAASAPSVTAPKPRDSPVGVSLAASNANASSKQLLLLWVLVSLVLLPL
jgi:hypothetical protein